MSLNIALLIDDTSLKEWERRALVHLLNENTIDTTLSLVIVNESETSSSLSELVWTFLTEFSLWNSMLAVQTLRDSLYEPPWYRKQVALDDALDISNATVLSCRPEPVEEAGVILPDDAVAALADTDVAIRFGFGILKGEALTAPRYGVLSYHHGDVTEYRGRPAGFYEFVHGESIVGVTIQRLTETLDAGTVVATTECDITEAGSLHDVRDEIFGVSPKLLTESVKRLRDGQFPPQPETLGPVYSTPGARDVLSYLRNRMLL